MDAQDLRPEALEKFFERELNNHLLYGNLSSFLHQVLFWASIFATGTASILNIGKFSGLFGLSAGVYSALAVALLLATKQAGLEERAHWHYSRSDLTMTLLNRLRYCSSDPPTRPEICKLVDAFNAGIVKLSAQVDPRRRSQRRHA